MFTKNFYRRLWLHWLTPSYSGTKIFPQEMFGKTATPKPCITLHYSLPSSSTLNSFALGKTVDGFSCGTEIASLSLDALIYYGQYVPSSYIHTNNYNSEKTLLLSEDSYDVNTFYDTVVAKAPITFEYTVRASASNSDLVYDATTDSIKKTYSYTVTNSTGSTKTVRSISGTASAVACNADGTDAVNTYMLIWAINLDTPVEINKNESATLTITYRWDNCTPGSQANPYSISASISQ